MKMTELQIFKDFNRALEEKQLHVYYQPQYDCTTERIVGVEALARWIHPVYGMQISAEFIPVIEKMGMIPEMDKSIFESICVFLRECLDSGMPIVPVSANFSRYDLYNENFINDIETIRKKYDIPVSLLRAEVTETLAVSDNMRVKSMVERLREIGYIVEIDDFGSAYSSLGVLKDIEFDVIKLDMSFLRGTIGNRGKIILRNVVHMCHELGVPVIAEGVETQEQSQFMCSIGCNLIQGFLYSKPVPEDVLVGMLANNALAISR